MKRGFDRTQRIADLIQKTLAQILLQQSDARFRFVTVTDVNVSKDLSYAKVYVSLLTDDEKEIKQIVEDLNHNMKSFRYQLAQEVELRVIPELKFIYDESTARGYRISSLIDSALKKNEEN